MPDDVDLKRAYQNGYRAGVKSRPPEPPLQPLLDKLYVASVQAFLSDAAWETGGKKITSLEDRLDLAARAAREALKRRPRA